MLKVYFLICTFVLIESYSCWVIDPKMLDENMLADLDGIEIDEVEKRIIFPGTKWCGAGNKSTNYDDLGWAREADMCCREHDHCPDLIPAGGSKYNLTNTASYTRLSCSCDIKFYNCLKAADTYVGGMVGRTYFNVLGTQCYRKAHPATCKSRTIVRRICKEYSYDKTKEEVYQWFDVKVY